MESKSIFASRTFWVNVVSMIATLGGAYGLDLSAEQQASLVTAILTLVNVVNIGLRAVTKGPVHVTKGE